VNKTLFENYREGLTVGELKKLLVGIPDDLPVCVNLLGSYFPANQVRHGQYKLYPHGCDGVAQGEAECIKIG